MISMLQAESNNTLMTTNEKKRYEANEMDDGYFNIFTFGNGLKRTKTKRKYEKLHNKWLYYLEKRRTIAKNMVQNGRFLLYFPYLCIVLHPYEVKYRNVLWRHFCG